MNYKAVSEADKAKLVAIIIQASKATLEFDVFAETVAMLSEDIPGLESDSDEDMTKLINECWEIYLAHPVATSGQ